MADKRLIDANALKVRMFRSKEFNRDTGSFDLPVVPWHDIEDADTIDAVEVVHGRWVFDRPNHYKCSLCDAMWSGVVRFMKFCPDCGMPMDGGAEC